MFITVKHLPTEKRRDASCIYDDEELLNFVSSCLKHNELFRVADIEIEKDRRPLDSILEYAYRMTQNVEGTWVEHENIKAFCKGTGCRSTSKGDVIMINGVAFIVASFGFIEIKG